MNNTSSNKKNTNDMTSVKSTKGRTTKSTKSTKPTNPTKSIKTTNPTKSTKSTNPTKSIKQTTPTKSIKQTNPTDCEKEIESITEKLYENYMQQKQLVAKLEKLNNTSSKNITGVQTKVRDTYNITNWSCEYNIPDKVRKILSIEEPALSKFEFTQALYRYIVSNKLIDKKTKHTITMDKNLIKIFSNCNITKLDWYDLQGQIKQLFDSWVE